MARELHIGGSERQMTEIAKGLDRSTFEPHVACFRPSGMRGDELRAAGVPVVQFPVHSYKSPSAVGGMLSLARYVRRNGIRLVHTWDYPTTVMVIPAIRMLTRAVALSSQRAHRELTPGVYLKLTRISDRFAHGIVVNCDFLRRHLIHDEKVPERKVRVCYNGIDLERFRRAASGPRPFTIGVVCGLRPEKDLPTLIKAFARLDAEARLVIVGSGDELPRLQQCAREESVETRCHFEPATNKVTEWLSAIDVFVLPSLSEAFSNALMEAMACGCCAVASNVGGNPELIRDGETGLLFTPGDRDDLASALRRLMADPALRRDLATRGEAFIRENLSLQKAAQQMGNIYREMLATT